MSIPSFGDPSVGAPPTTAQQTYQYEAPEIQARKLGLMDIAGRLAQGETPAYGGMQIPTQQLAAFDPQQQQAFDLASQGIGGYQPYMQQAQQYAQKAADPTSYQDFMNPYQQEVIGGIESQFQKLQNQAAARGVQTGAFGGAREGIQSAELGRQQAEAVGQSKAQNYLQAQQSARGDFENQMARYGAAGQASAGLGQQVQQQIQQDVASSMAAGSVQQQRAQQMQDASYRQQIQQAAEPYQRMGFVSDIYSKVPSTQMATTMGTSPMTNPLAQVLGGGIMGLGMYQGYGQQ